MITSLIKWPWRPLWVITLIALWPGVLETIDGAGGHLLRFAVCGIGLIPVAVALSDVVERLVERLGGRLGGLISGLLGNLVEFLGHSTP